MLHDKGQINKNVSPLKSLRKKIKKIRAKIYNLRKNAPVQSYLSLESDLVAEAVTKAKISELVEKLTVLKKERAEKQKQLGVKIYRKRRPLKQQSIKLSVTEKRSPHNSQNALFGVGAEPINFQAACLLFESDNHVAD
jgi:hypothetical protein